jgi:hypothetical protein
MASETIEIVNVGCVRHLTIPVAPGIVCLRGRSDIGKSCALDAVNRLAGGDADLLPRRGTEKGTVEGLGIKITVGRSTRRRRSAGLWGRRHKVAQSFHLYDSHQRCSKTAKKARPEP